MSDEAGTGSSGGSGVFTRGFLPGLVLGVVLGAAVGFLSTEVIGKSPKRLGDGPPAMTASGPRDAREEGVPSAEERQRLAEEAANALREDDSGSGDEQPDEGPGDGSGSGTPSEPEGDG